MEAGATLILRNAKIDMFKGSMRLSVPDKGSIEKLSAPLSLKANVDPSAKDHCYVHFQAILTAKPAACLNLLPYRFAETPLLSISMFPSDELRFVNFADGPQSVADRI